MSTRDTKGPEREGTSSSGTRPATGAAACRTAAPAGLAGKLLSLQRTHGNRYARQVAGKLEAVEEKTRGDGKLDSKIDTREAEVAGGVVGGVIGSAIGATLGGPLGAVVGAGAGIALGALVGHLLARKTLTLNITKVEGSTRSTTVDDASKILEDAANVKISVGKVKTLTKTESEAAIGTDLVLDEYAAPGSPTAEEVALTAINRTPNTLTAYFVKAMSAGSHGESFWPSGFPTVPASVAIKNGDSPFVAGKPLAHELCHVLLDDGGHSSDTKNLMSYSHDGVGLTAGEVKKVRSSTFVK
ncbi:hypothetical protein [Geobacter sp.]|uniref:hypothetical protein n=1 Tax=Geobacter sp. TaxID=46610 RepID=UPI00260793FA|nr:hypothetical protein [Geobacter sp.]